MHVRLATRDDLADIATVVSRAMINDELSLWLNPAQKQNPRQYRERCLQTTKRRWNNGLYLIVAVLDENDPEWAGKSTVIGYAAYEKEVGAPDDSSKRKRTLFLGEFLNHALLLCARDLVGQRANNRPCWSSEIALERWLCSIEEDYTKYFRNFLGTDRSRLATLSQEVSKSEATIKFTAFWEVSLLTVDPAFGRRGIGAELLGWGKARAREDKVPLWLWASVQGYPLYRRQGFEEFGEVRCGHGDEPAPMMVWLPESFQ